METVETCFLAENTAVSEWASKWVNYFDSKMILKMHCQ